MTKTGDLCLQLSKAPQRAVELAALNAVPHQRSADSADIVNCGVSQEQDLGLLKEQGDAAGCVSGRMNDPQPSQHRDDISILHRLLHRCIVILHRHSSTDSSPAHGPAIPVGRLVPLVLNALPKKEIPTRPRRRFVTVRYHAGSRQLVKLVVAARMVEMKVSDHYPAQITGTPAQVLYVFDNGVPVSGDSSLHHGHLLIHEQHGVTAVYPLNAMYPRSYLHLTTVPSTILLAAQSNMSHLTLAWDRRVAG